MKEKLNLLLIICFFITSCDYFSSSYLDNAKKHLDEGNYNKALDNLIKAEILNENNPETIILLAETYKELLDYETARLYYYKAINIKPYDTRLIYALSGVEFDLGNYWSCISLAKGILGNFEHAPDHPYARIGLCYTGLLIFDSAYVYYNKAIEYRDDHASYYNNRGYALIDLSRYCEAMEDYNKAIRLDSLRPAFYLNKADLFYRLRVFDKAIENYTKSIELSKLYKGAYERNSIAFNNRAWAKLALGDTIGFIEDRKYAFELGYPDNYIPFENLESKFYIYRQN